MRKALAPLLALGLGLSAFCCGPKVKPPEISAPLCGETGEICELDDVGPHNCYCPE